MLLFTIVICTIVFLDLEMPNNPSRGAFFANLQRLVTLSSVVVIYLLVIWNFLNTKACNQFIIKLSKIQPSGWSVSSFKNKYALLDDAVYQQWADINFVADITRIFQPLIWPPLLCIGLMVLARNSGFDDWDMPNLLIIIYLMMVLFTIYTEFHQLSSARQIREKAIQSLKFMLDT